MNNKQWNKILKDLHWDSPSYGWSIEKTILKRALRYERKQILKELLIKDPIGGFENSFNNRVKSLFKEKDE